MFAYRLLIALIISTSPLPVLADNTLMLPEKANLLALDGKSINNDNNRSGINLSDGRHQLVFQIKTIVKNVAGSKLYTSSSYIMTFNLQGNQKYKIQTPNFKTSRNIDQLERAPEQQFTLLNERGETTSFKFKSLHRPGMIIGNDLINDINKFNMSNDPAAVRELAGNSYTAETSGSYDQAQQPAPTAATSVTSENMLQYWYKQADSATRERFMKWVAEDKNQIK